MSQTIPNPITRQAAMVLLLLYEQSQTEERETWRHTYEWAFYSALEALSAQGIPGRRTSGEMSSVVIDAYNRHFVLPAHTDAGAKTDTITDNTVAAEFHDQLSRHRRSPWPAVQDLDAVADIVAAINGPVSCTKTDCDEAALDDDELCELHAMERDAEKRRNDEFLASFLQSKENSNG